MAKSRKPAANADVPPPVEPAPRAAAPGIRQRNVLSLKGSDEWKSWLDWFAASKGMPVTVLVDHALRELAKRDGYSDPPSRV